MSYSLYTLFSFRCPQCPITLESARKQSSIANLQGADDASDQLTLNVWRTRETTTLGCHVIQQGAIFVLFPTVPAHRVTVDTDVLRTVFVAQVAGHQVTVVLLVPPCGARAGGGHHEGGSSGRPAHGAHSVLFVVGVVEFILRAVEISDF